MGARVVLRLATMPEDVHDCVDKLKDHPEVDDPWALCNWMKSEGYDLPSSEADATRILDQARRARGMQDHDNAALDGNKRPHTTRSAKRPFDVEWLAQATAELVTEQPNPAMARAYPGARTIQLRGTFIDDTANLNGWRVPATELANIARQLKSGNVQLRLDHGEDVHKVIGVYNDGRLVDAAGNQIPLDAPEADLNRATRVDFGAIATIADANVAIPILRGFVRGVSPNLESANVACDKCGASSWPAITCDHFDEKGSVHVLRNTTVKEGSIVATPAYGNRTPFMPVGFAAGLAQKQSEVNRMTNPAATQTPAQGASPPAGAAERDIAFRAMQEAAELRAQKTTMERELVEARAALEAAKKAQKEPPSDDDKKKEEKAAADKEAAARKKAAEDKLKEAEDAERTASAGAGKRTGAARAMTDAERLAGMPKRAFGAMAGPIDQQVNDAQFFAAFEEIKGAARRDPKYPMGLFGPQVDNLRAGGGDR